MESNAIIFIWIGPNEGHYALTLGWKLKALSLSILSHSQKSFEFAIGLPMHIILIFFYILESLAISYSFVFSSFWIDFTLLITISYVASRLVSEIK